MPAIENPKNGNPEPMNTNNKRHRAVNILIGLLLFTLIWLVWPTPETYVTNNALPTIRPTWPGNRLIGHRLSDRTYINMPEVLGGDDQAPSRALRKSSLQNQPGLKSRTWRDELILKIYANRRQDREIPDSAPLSSIPLSNLWQTTGNTAVWLGHASFFIRIDGITFLTDPSYSPSACGYPRLLPEPDYNQIRGLDYILLSSNQPTHADIQTLERLRINNPSGVMLVPLGLRHWLGDLTKSAPELIQEAGWFQQYRTYGNITVTLMPARSWSGPTLSERDRTLWGSFIIQTPGHTLYFAGSSGWGNHYEQIALHFPDIDYAFIPIGAFGPESVMNKSQLTPEDVSRLCQTLRPRHIIPMSYGTYMTGDPLGEPLEQFLDLAAQGLLYSEPHILTVGQIFALP